VLAELPERQGNCEWNAARWLVRPVSDTPHAWTLTVTTHTLTLILTLTLPQQEPLVAATLADIVRKLSPIS